mmetsp:Transcript_42807/g.97161  ORF Transcript_42807/g.97161 Transcript_42807/m.97161 type:complete len:285 (-) Transcript_42807:67-921(-)
MLDSGELLHEDIAILHGLATALPQVGHHGVASVAHERDGPVSPGAEEGRRPVVERTVLDGLRRRGLDEVVDLLRPAQEAAEEVVLLAVGRGGQLGALGHAAEGVPLDAAPADVGADEVPLGAHVDLVAHVEVVLRPVDRLAREDRVAAVGAAGAGPLLRLAPHLRARGRPDAVGADEHVALLLGAVLEAHAHASVVGQDLVGAHFGGVGHRALRQRLQEHRLQVWPVDDAGVGELEHLRGRLHGVEGAEPLGAQGVDEAVPAVPGEGEVLHQLVEEGLVDVPEH